MANTGEGLNFNVDTGQLGKLSMLREITYKSMYYAELMEWVSKDCWYSLVVQVVLDGRSGLDRQAGVLEGHKPLQRHDCPGGENTYPTRLKDFLHTYPMR